MPKLQERIKTTHLMVGIVAAMVVLFSAFKTPVYHVLDVQTMSAQVKRDAAQDTLIAENHRANDAELAALRQNVACILWKVDPEDCDRFKIPSSGR